jgi:hypothetical protein
MSILKVNTIQDKGGNAIISSDGSGTITPSFGVGKIGQVVTAQPVTSDFSTSSSSYTDVTNLNASITPTATSSKILVLFYGMLYASGSSQGVTARGRILRGSTALNSWQASAYDQGNSGVQTTNSATFTILDSPSTTSEVTYKIQIKKSEGSNATLKAGANDSDNSTPTFVLMEVLA